MNQWSVSVQKMIDWIEHNIENNPTLLEMSNEVGYSPYYCSSLFHKISGMTLKSYLAGRRLCYIAVALRDTSDRIIDIALRYGFSSQEALTRAFVMAYGCTPYSYRMEPRPIKLSIKQVVLNPDKILFGGIGMSTVKEANVRFEYIPAHKYIGIWDIRAKNYGDFWKYHNCDEVCGIIDSMRHVSLEVVGCHQAGWFYENRQKGYFYGFGVPCDYSGKVPDGFEIRDIPASTYLVFFHPPFDYLADNGDVMGKVENLAWNYNPKESGRWWIPGGYEWNETICPNYQRHFPEVLGYEVLRPVKKV
ncbi:MAG: AraC family transcriptional regulator [Defluviitaleaceae bacterium]|nr:AraC family transcriptional regulator [Defluviitaleaceae bacterium]